MAPAYLPSSDTETAAIGPGSCYSNIRNEHVAWGQTSGQTHVSKLESGLKSCPTTSSRRRDGAGMSQGPTDLGRMDHVVSCVVDLSWEGLEDGDGRAAAMAFGDQGRAVSPNPE